MSKNTRLKRITKEKKEKLKVARPVPEFDIYHTRKWCDRNERTLSVSEEHKPYIRGKRLKAGQPNSWETQWISRSQVKSWKSVSRKKKQWMKHKVTKSEWLNKFQTKVDKFLKNVLPKFDFSGNYFYRIQITETYLFKNFRKEVEEFKEVEKK
jgi:hypothetical protein